MAHGGRPYDAVWKQTQPAAWQFRYVWRNRNPAYQLLTTKAVRSSKLGGLLYLVSANNRVVFQKSDL